MTSTQIKNLILEIVNEEVNSLLEKKAGKTSAGILMWRKGKKQKDIEVLLALPGGPFWAGKDLGSWGIPKGELEEGEDPLAAAFREFAEETGYMPKGKAIKLPDVKTKGGKTIMSWAIKGDVDPASFSSNTFELEWPKGSGKIVSFPEIEKIEWFNIKDAKNKIAAIQQPLIDAIITIVNK